MAARVPLASKKIAVNMREMDAGQLHSGSKSGPKVTSPKQAIAIGMNEARKAAPATGPKRLPFGRK
jgi:hypothetical protein